MLLSCSDNWDYSTASGPNNWGDLKEEYKFCKIGYNQSPIDVKESDFSNNELKFFYNKSDIEKQFKNHAMIIEFDSRDFILRGKKKYFIRRAEFHHPSEHLIDGVAHSLEMQIYHKSDDEQWLAIAIFLEVGKENPEFKKLIEFFSNQKKEGVVDLSKIVKQHDKIFFYDGSLTTPPCTEGMKWYVLKTAIEISKEQMNQIIKSTISVKTNARPVQKFNPEKY